MNVYEEVDKGTFLEAARTGSRYICDPPVMDTDDDYICLVASLTEIHKTLMQDGWDLGGSGYRNSLFSSHKKTVNGTTMNLICTDDADYFKRFLHATETAKKLNLTDKEDRIILFRAIVDFVEIFERDSLIEEEEPVLLQGTLGEWTVTRWATDGSVNQRTIPFGGGLASGSIRPAAIYSAQPIRIYSDEPDELVSPSRLDNQAEPNW